MPAKRFGSKRLQRKSSKSFRPEIRSQMRRIVTDNYLVPLRVITDPLKCEFAFNIQTVSDGGNLKFNVVPAKGIPLENPNPGVEDTYDLFKLLNDGGPRFWQVGHIPNFGIETAPDSTITVGVDYDRTQAFPSDNPLPDIQPRNWTRIIAEERANKIVSDLTKIVLSYVP